MSATANPIVQTPAAWILPYRGKVAMGCLIVAESAIFTIFVVAYIFYIGKSLSGPVPREVLEVPIFFTICLLSSSLTVHFASKSLDLLFARRPSRISRHRWPANAPHRAVFRNCGTRRP